MRSMPQWYAKTKSYLSQFREGRPLIFGLVCMIFSGSVLALLILQAYPPPEAVTRYRFTLIEKKFKTSRPVSREKVNPDGGHSQNLKKECDIRDGWNFPILWTLDEQGFCVLTSLGADGIPGGQPDLTYRFPLTQ